MGRTACTEPQWLYKGDLYLYLIISTEIQILILDTYHIRRSNIYVSKDVKIRGYFTKSNGVGEQKFWETLKQIMFLTKRDAFKNIWCKIQFS